MNKWYEDCFMENDIIVSSRISLSRNIKDLPFSSKISEAESEYLLKTVKNAFFETFSEQFYTYEDLREMDPLKANALKDVHVISRKLDAQNKIQGIILSKDESENIRINGKDHINIVSISRGEQLFRSYEMAKSIDDQLNKKITYAFSERYGYLTSSPGDMGTGMRASYFLHLPMFASAGLIESTVKELNKCGLDLRPLYSHGKEAAGHMFQMYNKTTLGISEEDILASLKDTVKIVVEHEQKLRKEHMEKHYIDYQDTILKAYGILKYAKKLSEKEAINFLSSLRLGVKEGLIFLNNADIDFYQMMLFSRKDAIDYYILNHQSNDLERDVARASFIKMHLPALKTD